MVRKHGLQVCGLQITRWPVRRSADYQWPFQLAEFQFAENPHPDPNPNANPNPNLN